MKLNCRRAFETCDSAHNCDTINQGVLEWLRFLSADDQTKESVRRLEAAHSSLPYWLTELGILSLECGEIRLSGAGRAALHNVCQTNKRLAAFLSGGVPELAPQEIDLAVRSIVRSGFELHRKPKCAR